MKTLYIDVYFMINFTVDILAVFIAARMIHSGITVKRLVLSGIIGAIYATAELFLYDGILHVILAASFLLLILHISCRQASLLRKVKFLLSFYIASFLISGAVSFIYNVMDRYIDDLPIDTSNSTNRKAIIFSLIILLMIGAIRLFIMMFTESLNEKSTKLRMELGEKSLDVEALVDTGNLVKDPMNMNPVIFLKKSCAESIIPTSVIELSNIDELTPTFRKRIRLIPVSRNGETHVMIGIRMDAVMIIKENYREEINATVVIDKEEGTFGGYYALAPYVAACNV